MKAFDIKSLYNMCNILIYFKKDNDMDSIMNDFDVNKPLPEVIAIKSAENHLYRIGLSLFSFGSQKKNRFHNPFFVSSILLVAISVGKDTFDVLYVYNTCRIHFTF